MTGCGPVERLLLHDPGAHLGGEVGTSVSRRALRYPRQVRLADALPKGPTGKILKREIVAPTEG